MISGSAVVTLAGVHIDTAQGAALEVDDHAGTDVTLILENDNTLISRKSEKAKKPAFTKAAAKAAASTPEHC